jgi:hypothetical protein
MKIWLIRKIEKVETELKYLKALLIMLYHVEQADDYSESDDGISVGSDDDSIKASDIKLLDEDNDEDDE